MVIEGIHEGDGAVMAPAVAQPAPALAPAGGAAAPGGVDAAQRADQHFLRGKALLKEGKKEAALAEYRAAWGLKKTYDIAGNLGSLEIDLGMYRDAAEHLSFAVRHYATTGTTQQQLERAKQRLAEARKHVGAVTVTVSVDGAEVLVDGVSVGRAPLESEVFVEPGVRVIEARLAGHTAAKAEAQAEKGGSMSVTLTLTPLPVAAPPGVGPATPVSTAGNPRTVQGAGAVEGADTRRSLVPAIALGAGSAVSLVVAIGTTVASNGASTDKDAQREAILRDSGQCAAPAAGFAERCGELRSTAERADTLGNVARVAYAASGALAIGAVVYLLWPQSGHAAKVQVVPVLGAGQAGMGALGAW